MTDTCYHCDEPATYEDSTLPHIRTCPAHTYSIDPVPIDGGGDD